VSSNNPFAEYALKKKLGACDRGLFESEIAEKLPTSVIYETACNITRQNFGDKLRLYDQCKLKI
jgi:hypothetical protein